MSDAWLASFILLWFLVIANTVALLAIGREVALLARRLPGEAARRAGPRLGSPLSDVQGQALGGNEVIIRGEALTSAVLLFLSDNCQACDEMLAGLSSLRTEAGDYEFVVLLEREPAADLPLVAAFRDEIVVSPGAFRTFDVGVVPFAVVVKDGVPDAKGQLPHLEHLRESMGLAPINEEEVNEHREAWEDDRDRQPA